MLSEAEASTSKTFFMIVRLLDPSIAQDDMLHDNHWFDVFSVKFIEGNSGFMNDEGQVAISDRLARELWGDESLSDRNFTSLPKCPSNRDA